MVKISKHVSYREGVYSRTAERLGLNNDPNSYHLNNMKIISENMASYGISFELDYNSMMTTPLAQLLNVKPKVFKLTVIPTAPKIYFENITFEKSDYTVNYEFQTLTCFVLYKIPQMHHSFILKMCQPESMEKLYL